VRFVLLVEGATERLTAGSFLRKWLCPPRLKQPVGVHVKSFRGYADLARKVVDLAQMQLDDTDRGDILAVIGLLDLYGPDFYPGHATTAKDRYDWGVAYFERAVQRDRFRMFFAVHEFEAWLLAQPEIFPNAVRSAFPGKIANPERIDFNEHPVLLLDKLYKSKLGKGYRKTTDGRNLFEKLDPAVALGKCPYLKKMLDDMVQIAKDAGL
jgi:hypothetical protein